MAINSTIEWTEATWNPLTGCTKISAGCKNCYAERMAQRLKAMGSPNYENGFQLTVHEHLISVPLQWRRPRTVFVNSMGDLFHEDVDDEFILRIFDVMKRAVRHRFQVLTKRSQRLLELSDRLPWPKNVWMGVTIESDDYRYRADHLSGIGAKVKFLSLEPLLGPIPELDLRAIHWVIVGGESGPKARPMSATWAIEIRDKCLEARVPFFFKQWGGRHRLRAGRILEGRAWDQMPTDGAFKVPEQASLSLNHAIRSLV